MPRNSSPRRQRASHRSCPSLAIRGRRGHAVRDNFSIAEACNLVRLELHEFRLAVGRRLVEVYDDNAGRQRVTHCELFSFALSVGLPTDWVGDGNVEDA